MALKGTLKDFSVADIFQLIGQQGKSGSLYIRKPEEEVHIVFDDGKVVLGTFKKGHEDLLLGTMLLNGGAITAQQLDEAMNNQQVSMRSIGDILRGMKVISTETLSEFIALQLKEVLFRLFQWTNGLYEFVPGKLKFNKNIIRPQSAEAVLMDGFRMLDEWPAIEKKVVSTESVFKCLADPSDLLTTEKKDEPEESSEDDMDLNLDAAFGEFDDSPAKKEPTTPQTKLSAQERLVLRLMDSERSLQTIAFLSRLGTFETCHTTAELLDRGLCVRLDQASVSSMLQQKPIETQSTFSEWASKSLKPLLLALFLAIALPLVAFGPPSYVRHHYELFADAEGKKIDSTLSLASVEIQKQKVDIEEMMEVYRLREGFYPESPKVLGEASWLEDWTIEKVRGEHRAVLKSQLEAFQAEEES